MKTRTIAVGIGLVLPKFSLKLSELSSNPNQTRSLGLGLGNSPLKLNSGVQFGQKPQKAEPITIYGKSSGFETQTKPLETKLQGLVQHFG